MITNLQPKLVPRYFARTEEHAIIRPREDEDLAYQDDEDVLPDERHRYPDVGVTLRDADAPRADAGTAVLVAPRVTAMPVDLSDPELHRWVEISDLHSREVVTVIELLSPANKAGDGRAQYLGKRLQTVRAGKSFVEIDLLRGGRRSPLRERPEADYHVAVCAHGESSRVGLWPFDLRDPLPDIPVPLRLEDGQVTLELRKVLDDVYDSAGYRYALEDPAEVGHVRPPLAEADAAWSRQILESAAAAK